MQILAAEWVLPVASPPIKDGAIAIEHDKIVAVGVREAVRKAKGFKVKGAA